MGAQGYAKCTLGIETHPTEPPKLMSIAVLVDGKPHGYVTLADFDATVKRLEELRAAEKRERGE